MTKSEKFLEILKTGKHITIEEAMKELESTRSGIYTVANTLRSKGYKIKTKRSINGYEYYLNNSNALIPSQSTSIIPKTHEPIILSDQDKQDFYELTKKSVYYKLCANALIEAAKESKKICLNSFT